MSENTQGERDTVADLVEAIGGEVYLWQIDDLPTGDAMRAIQEHVARLRPMVGPAPDPQSERVTVTLTREEADIAAVCCELCRDGEFPDAEQEGSVADAVANKLRAALDLKEK